MSGGKGAWERAASSVDAQVSRGAGSTVVGVARTRAVSACLVAAICFCLAFFAAHVAWDAMFIECSTGLAPSIAPSVPAESAGFIHFSFPAILCFFLFLCAMLSQADKKKE